MPQISGRQLLNTRTLIPLHARRCQNSFASEAELPEHISIEGVEGSNANILNSIAYARMFFHFCCMRRECHQPFFLPLTATSRRRKRRVIAFSTGIMSFSVIICVLYMMNVSQASTRVTQTIATVFGALKRAFRDIDWRSNAGFRVTHAMKVSIAMSMTLGVLLGVGVGLISGLEPAVIIGVSASMALGCVFVMSFAILHGVNALRAVSFALFVSTCLPFGFGIGFGIGILMGVFIGLEDADDIREKTSDFVRNFGEFLRIVTAFTLEIS